MNSLKKWTFDNKFNFKNKDCEKASHLLLDGGKVYIPVDKEYDFIVKYAEEMKKGTKLYYVETRPNVFKFMIDVDIKDDRFWSFDEVLELSKIIQSVVFEFYDKNNVTICCISSPKKKGEHVHTGVHFIWPDICINSDKAKILRTAIIKKIKDTKLFVLLTKYSSLEDTFDARIYSSNGYRMVGSDKYNRETKEPENRELKLSFVMNSDTSLNDVYKERLENDTVALIAETSIRYVLDIYHSPESKGMDFKYIPKWIDKKELKKDSKGSNEIVGTKDHVILQYFINKYIPDYKDIIINKVSRYPDNNILITTSSKYCMNLQGNHKSCGIYFFATPEGVFQKCLCPCENLKGRKYGYCRDYTSDCYPFPDDFKTQLFPPTPESIKKAANKEKEYVPGSTTKRGILKKQKNACDKLLNDILMFD